MRKESRRFTVCIKGLPVVSRRSTPGVAWLCSGGTQRRAQRSIRTRTDFPASRLHHKSCYGLKNFCIECRSISITDMIKDVEIGRCKLLLTIAIICAWTKLVELNCLICIFKVVQRVDVLFSSDPRNYQASHAKQLQVINSASYKCPSRQPKPLQYNVLAAKRKTKRSTSTDFRRC